MCANAVSGLFPRLEFSPYNALTPVLIVCKVKEAKIYTNYILSNDHFLHSLFYLYEWRIIKQFAILISTRQAVMTVGRFFSGVAPDSRALHAALNFPFSL